MKIHGTAKGGALSTKDFGVAFGGGVAAQTFIDNPISDVWEVVNTALWTIGSGRATCSIGQPPGASSNPNICRYDLNTNWGNNLSDTTWTIRWSAELNNVTGSNGFHSMPISVTSDEGSVEASGNMIEAFVLDSAGIGHVYSTYCSWVDSGTHHSSDGSYSTAAQAEDTQYWYELQRIAADDFTLKTYDADTYDVADQVGDTWQCSEDPQYSASDVEAITDLRYIELGYRNGNAGFAGNGWNYLFEVYNNTLSP